MVLGEMAGAPAGNPALLDTATGALSRAAFLLRLEEAVALAARLVHSVSMLVVDVLQPAPAANGAASEEVNAVLAGIVDKVWALARRSDTVARLGPGRLAVLLPATDEAGAINYAERLEPLLAGPFWLGGREIPARVALSVICPPPGEAPVSGLLLEAAER